MTIAVYHRAPMPGDVPSWSRAARWVVAAIALVATSGCVTDQGYLSVATTQPVTLDATQLDVETLPVMRDVGGRHTAVTSILFVPTFAGPRLDAAVDDALARGHGDLLTRVRVTTYKFWLGIGIETLSVHGNVVDLPETP